MQLCKRNGTRSSMYFFCTCKIHAVKYRSVEYVIDILHEQNLLRVNDSVLLYLFVIFICLLFIYFNIDLFIYLFCLIVFIYLFILLIYKFIYLLFVYHSLFTCLFSYILFVYLINSPQRTRVIVVCMSFIQLVINFTLSTADFEARGLLCL